MNYWLATDKGDKKKIKNYVVYTIVGTKRFSFVNRYSSFYEYAKKKYLDSKKNVIAPQYYKITERDKQIIEENIKISDAIFFLKEMWNPNQGWVPYFKNTKPDEEFVHYILCANWEIV